MAWAKGYYTDRVPLGPFLDEYPFFLGRIDNTYIHTETIFSREVLVTIGRRATTRTESSWSTVSSTSSGRRRRLVMHFRLFLIVVMATMSMLINFDHQGFQLTHSLGGGTGSGFGTLLMTR